MNEENKNSLTADAYDLQWSMLHDFIQYNPGARHRRRLIARAIRNLNDIPMSVIDAGCGLGMNVVALKEVLPGARITGIDFSSVAIEGARQRFPEFEWKQVDLNNPPDLQPVDLVVCTEVIEHMESPESLVISLRKLVKPNGYLVLTTQAGKVHSTEVAVGHLRHFTLEELTRIVSAAGFDTNETAQWGWPGYLCLKKLANLRPQTTMSKLGSGRYGQLAKTLNHIFYYLTRATSMRRHDRGTQLLLVARKNSST
jgi:2-polyprenyl-3-methyl-5-hydroxy-6-metoxy-1,4-benzoquinol methylase